jgi:hypothetical protein
LHSTSTSFVAVLDQDRTDVSRRYIADLTGDGVFEVVSYLSSYDEIERLMQTGRAKVAIVIPHGATDGCKPGGLPKCRP